MGNSSGRVGAVAFVHDYNNFAVSVGETLKDFVRFLVTTPRAIPSHKRRIMVLQIDIYLDFVTNHLLRLRELDGSYANNIALVTMFDRILFAMWTIMERRYPDIVKNTNLEHPLFLAALTPAPVCSDPQYSFLKQMATIIETILQCSSMLMEANFDEMKDIQSKSSVGILNILNNRLLDILNTFPINQGDIKNSSLEGIKSRGVLMVLEVLQESCREIFEMIKQVDTMVARIHASNNADPSESLSPRQRRDGTTASTNNTNNRPALQRRSSDNEQIRYQLNAKQKRQIAASHKADASKSTYGTFHQRTQSQPTMSYTINDAISTLERVNEEEHTELAPKDASKE